MESKIVLGLVDLLKSEDIKTNAIEFAKYVEQNIDSVCNELESLDKALAVKVNEISSAEEDIREAVKYACTFIDTIDDFLYYGQNTDFVTIKEDIRKGKTLELKRFLSKMDKWLKSIEEAYKTFREKCNQASYSCTECANSCASHQAKAKTKKLGTGVLGGIVSAAMLGGGITASVVAGVFTLGTGAVVGLSITAASLGATSIGTAVVTGITAHGFSKAETSFKSASSVFRELAMQGIALKSHFNDIYQLVEKYERNHTFINRLDWSDINTTCNALDKLKAIFHLTREKISEPKEALLALKQKNS